MSADDFTVTPWNVSGKIDYEKLTKRFGTEKMTHAIEKYAKSDPGYVHLMERPDFFKTKKTNRQQISLTDEDT